MKATVKEPHKSMILHAKDRHKKGESESAWSGGKGGGGRKGNLPASRDSRREEDGRLGAGEDQVGRNLDQGEEEGGGWGHGGEVGLVGPVAWGTALRGLCSPR